MPTVQVGGELELVHQESERYQHEAIACVHPRLKFEAGKTKLPKPLWNFNYQNKVCLTSSYIHTINCH